MTKSFSRKKYELYSQIFLNEFNFKKYTLKTLNALNELSKLQTQRNVQIYVFLFSSPILGIQKLTYSEEHKC